jgi:capsule polysaccharide export protein KpsC/LpsZ
MGKTKGVKSAKKIVLSENAKKIIAGMKKVREDLIAYKKSKNSPLVIMRDGKIEYVDPFTLK